MSAPRHKNFIRVARDNWSLEEAVTGKPFTPVGCNYYDPHTGWPPQTWTRFNRASVKRHFRMMEDLKVNAIRVFLQWSAFMPERGTLAAPAIDHCLELLALAKASGIRVNLTGPELWGICPRWLSPQSFHGYQQFVDPSYSDAHSTFWGLLAELVSREETIYGFDLVNEPFMPWDGERMRRLWNQWLRERYDSLAALRQAWRSASPPGLRWGTIQPPPNCRVPGSQYLLDYQLFREEKALAWTRNTVGAIRSSDSPHLVTVGLHQSGFPPEESIPSRYTAFNPHRLKEVLDYVALHWYAFGNPLAASVQPFDLPSGMARNLSMFLANCRYSYVGKPLILEECSYYGGGSPSFWGGVLPYRTEAQQAEFSTRFITVARNSVGGWLNWPLQDTPSATDTSAFGGFYTASGDLKAWGKAFRKIASQYRDARLRRSQARVHISATRAALLTDIVECDKILRRCFTLFKRGRAYDFTLGDD